VLGAWQTATVVAIRDETRTAKTFRLALDAPTGHRAGQHYVVRLTAPDGYTATRSYSVASAPEPGNELELTVERFADGEVSAFLHDVVVPGDEVEVRGPIGNYFVWDADSPALLLGGGSGVVPLMAMLRLARATGRVELAHLVVSARTPDDLYYADELVGRIDTTVVLTRATPPNHGRVAGRVRADDVLPHLHDDATLFVCGSTSFTAAIGELLVELGVAPTRMRFERFGPTA
jgi:ferredoxin-NADP reductase